MPAAVGLIGIGMLGEPVARCLVGAGYDVTVCDLLPERAASVAGARVAIDPRELARGSDIVVCCVDGPDAATDVALGDDGASNGVVGAMAPGAVYVELTTMSVDAVRAESSACASRGVGFVEAPVSGRPPRLTALLGGAAPDIAQVADVVAAFTDHSFHLGPVGAATVAKLVNQYLTYANLMVAAQGLEVGIRNGVAPTDLAEALTACAGASRSLSLLHSMLTQRDVGYGSVAAIRRDIELFAALSDASSTSSATLAELRQLFGAAPHVDDGRPFPSVLARYGLET